MNVKSKVEATNLLEHLEQMYDVEHAELIDIAVNAMEGDTRVPFGELSLVDSQKEYKLKQQRVLGILDTIEEVKAFLEGYFDGPPHDEEGVK